MEEFILLTRLSSDVIESPKSLEDLEKKVMKRIQTECPQVEWIQNYAVLGPYDYLDVFRAPGSADAFKVAAIIRSFGHAHTEIWGARKWSAFKEMVRDLPGRG